MEYDCNTPDGELGCVLLTYSECAYHLLKKLDPLNCVGSQTIIYRMTQY